VGVLEIGVKVGAGVDDGVIVGVGKTFCTVSVCAFPEVQE
jgi:hypothetical protein